LVKYNITNGLNFLTENDLSMKNKTPFYKFLPVFCLFCFNNKLNAQSVDTVTVLKADIEKYIGFDNQKLLTVSSSISTIKGTDLRKAFTNNITNALYGRLPGLTMVQGNSEPGNNNATAYIRGANTFGFSGSPLIIIDGFLGDFSQLVPEEIEEISVLKDAAATAVYGMRGANGVVLVTTKKGVSQPLSVNFNAQYGIQDATALPKFLNSYNYASLFNEALANDGKPALYTQADLDAYQNGSDPAFRPNVNWSNLILRNTAPLSNYNLNFTGGNSTVKFFAMLNTLTSEGLYKKFGNSFNESSNPNYTRYNFRANVDVTLTKRLSAQLNIGGSVDDKKNPGDLYTNNNINLLDRVAPNAFPAYNPNGSFGGNPTFPGNPLANLTSTGFSTSNATTLQSSLRFTEQLDMIAKGLSASVAVSFNNLYQAASNKRKAYQRFSIVKNTLGDTVYTGFGQKTSLTPQEIVLSQFRNYAVQASLNYKKIVGVHGFSGLLIYNTDNYIIDKQVPNTDAANQAFPYKSNGVSTRLTYTNNEKYIAEFSGSYMGTENFPDNRRYGFFPAMALGWVASKERFLQESKLIDFLKMRVSYGLSGNENIGGQRFAFAQRYPSVAAYYLGTGNIIANSLGEGRRLNTNVTWEKEKKANIGIELNMAKRIGIVVDVFKNSRYDILSSANGTLPLFLGFNGLPDLNIGKASTKGFEISVKYNNDAKKTLQFFAEAFAAYAKNIIDFNGEPQQPNTNLYKTGYAIDQPFGLQALGLFQNAADIAGSAVPLGIAVKPGDIKYKDIGGPNGVPDGVIDGNDATAIGKTSIPEFTYGLNTGISFKQFDVNLIFQGVSGVTQYLSGSRFHAFQNNGQITEAALDRWSTNNTSAAYPRLSSDNNQNNYRFSSFWQKDGSFIKLRVAEVGYTFSTDMLKKIRLSQARVFVNGTNLFTLDKIKEGDADALYGYPQIRTISFGVKIHLL